METFLSSNLDEVSTGDLLVLAVILLNLMWRNSLVGANTGSFKSLRAQLFVLIGDHVYAERELVDICTLATEVEDSNLWVRYTTVESGLWVWLRYVSRH